MKPRCPYSFFWGFSAIFAIFLSGWSLLSCLRDSSVVTLWPQYGTKLSLWQLSKLYWWGPYCWKLWEKASKWTLSYFIFGETTVSKVKNELTHSVLTKHLFNWRIVSLRYLCFVWYCVWHHSASFSHFGRSHQIYFEDLYLHALWQTDKTGLTLLWLTGTSVGRNAHLSLLYLMTKSWTPQPEVITLELPPQVHPENHERQKTMPQRTDLQAFREISLFGPTTCN